MYQTEVKDTEYKLASWSGENDRFEHSHLENTVENCTFVTLISTWISNIHFLM